MNSARIVPNKVGGSGCSYPDICMVFDWMCCGRSDDVHMETCMGVSSRSGGSNHLVPPAIRALTMNMSYTSGYATSENRAKVSHAPRLAKPGCVQVGCPRQMKTSISSTISYGWTFVSN